MSKKQLKKIVDAAAEDEARFLATTKQREEVPPITQEQIEAGMKAIGGRIINENAIVAIYKAMRKLEP